MIRTHTMYQSLDEKSWLYLFTAFTGPMLASLLAGVWTLIPMENILTNPSKWWEFEIGFLVTILPMMYLAILAIAEYWAHMIIENFMQTFWMIFFCAQGVAILGMGIYYFIWTYMLELYQPMPFNALIFELLAAATAAVVIMYRYCRLFTTDVSFLFNFTFDSSPKAWKVLRKVHLVLERDFSGLLHVT